MLDRLDPAFAAMTGFLGQPVLQARGRRMPAILQACFT
jgi:hypothetical protein